LSARPFFLEQEQRRGFAKGAPVFSRRSRERSDILACLDWDCQGLVFFGRRLRQTTRSIPGIKRSSFEGDCAGREGCGGALLPERSETGPRLGHRGRECRVKPSAPARSQLGTSSFLPVAAASFPRRITRRASVGAGG